MKIADKIKQIRKESGKSQQEMSDILGLPRYIIANWEQGRSAPALEDIAKISECFNCSTDYLLGREDDTSNNAFFPEYIETKKGKFGNILRDLRKEKGFSQKELAQKIGVSPTNIYNYEVGRTEPSIDMLNIIADVLDVSVDYLIGRTDEFGETLPNSAVTIPGKPSESTSGVALSEDEKTLIDCFRSANAEDKRSILRVASSLVSDKKESLSGRKAN